VRTLESPEEWAEWKSIRDRRSKMESHQSIRDRSSKMDSESHYSRLSGRLSSALAAVAGNTVKILILDGCQFSDSGLVALVDALKINKTLEKISLHNVGIKQDRALAMVEALLSNNALKKLDLSANDLGEVAVAALANGLKINHKVSHLNLCDCGVDRNGLLALGLAIKATAAQRAEIFNLCSRPANKRLLPSGCSDRPVELRRVAVKLGFPHESWGWSNSRIMTEMLQLVEFEKMFAFVMGTHNRLGGANNSHVFGLNEHLCQLIHNVSGSHPEFQGLP
jgi:hypothetical protein